MVRDLPAAFACVRPAFGSLTVTSGPVVRTFTVVSRVTAVLIAFVRNDIGRVVERVLRVGLIDGDDRIANETADVTVPIRY